MIPGVNKVFKETSPRGFCVAFVVAGAKYEEREKGRATKNSLFCCSSSHIYFGCVLVDHDVMQRSRRSI